MELMNEGLIVFDMEAETKEAVVAKIADVMDRQGRLRNKNGYVADVLKREEGAPTSIGFLIATPHAKSVHVMEPSLAFARLKEPVQWANEKVKIVFQIAVPDPGQGEKHLEILAKISRKIIHDDFREGLMRAANKKEVLELVQ
ncbi:PTS sugar transporter subunit IIA [Anaerostipes sp.]|uniref:PTS sugar transporter subunit IIA n=1 Tax=Anaerostipes sp. TaxID=1872530 RepID=UPI0025BFC8F4|nr:PTS sugar transporter subunit IIA [Anaerostipes sp.]MBS7008652.1 PTS sugar transporter subunit IIA [Anaerostipes sp.]